MHRDQDFWDGIENYDEEIVSVFIKESILTDKINAIKNKHKKSVLDIGCGCGNSSPYINSFKKIILFDHSPVLIKQAESKFSQHSNVEVIVGEMNTSSLPVADVVLAVSSVWPKHKIEFEAMLKKLIASINDNGKLFLVLPSYESEVFMYHIVADYLISQETPPAEIEQFLLKKMVRSNFSPMGGMKTNTGIFQKFWLQEELEHILTDNNIIFNIEKLYLDWNSQMKNCSKLTEYPERWFWLIDISSK